jgi:diguanylate cyclase (GGDEF)-like protein/PAS domain S-box-containing protein
MDERRVLIVEDNPADERLTRMALSDGRRARYVVESAADLHEAVSLLHSEDPFDVVLLDLNLPDAAGLATVDELQAASKDVPIVVLTGLEDHEIGVAAIQRGAQDYLAKGALTSATLDQAIVYAVERHALRLEADDRTLALRRARSLLHGVVDGCADMMAALDTEGHFLVANTSYCREMQRLFGVEVEVGAQLRELLAPWPVEQELALDLWQRAIAGEEYTVQATLGESVGKKTWYELSFSALVDAAAGRLGAALVGRDITGQVRERESLQAQAYTDTLTGLPNRACFVAELKRALARARRDSSAGMALVLLDLDRFKVVNDSAGHNAGDELLRTVAKRLVAAVRGGDMVARLGGDEFVVLLYGCVHDAVSDVVVRRIRGALAGAPVEAGGRAWPVTASIGAALWSPECGGPEDLLEAADQAMYAAKRVGHDGIASR